MNEKNQQLLWDLYADITRDVKKNPTAIMETICRYCKECYKTQRQPWIDMWVLQQMKNVCNYLWPICGYCKRCQINQWLLWDLYAGIAYLKISL